MVLELVVKAVCLLLPLDFPLLVLVLIFLLLTATATTLLAAFQKGATQEEAVS
jgi:hypothetical protein